MAHPIAKARKAVKSVVKSIKAKKLKAGSPMAKIRDTVKSLKKAVTKDTKTDAKMIAMKTKKKGKVS